MGWSDSVPDLDAVDVTAMSRVSMSVSRRRSSRSQESGATIVGLWCTDLHPRSAGKFVVTADVPFGVTRASLGVILVKGDARGVAVSNRVQ